MKKKSTISVAGVDLTRSDLSKDEECLVLDALQIALVGTGNYIEKLFSVEAVQAYQQKIRNDILVDPMGDIKSMDQELQAAHARIRELEKNRDEYHGKLSEANLYADKLRESFHVATEIREERYQLVIKRNAELSKQLRETERLKQALKTIMISLDLVKEDE